MSVLLFSLEKPELEYYFHEMVQAFKPGIKNVIDTEADWDKKLSQRTLGLTIEYSIEQQGKECFVKTYKLSDKKDLGDKGIYKGYLYDFLSDYYKKTLMWGSLTGIKPVKIVQILEREGLSEQAIKERLVGYYRLSDDRSKLLIDLSKKQLPFIAAGQKKIGIYIGIPLCPSKCSYCSFVSTLVDRKKENLRQYFNNLLLEIDAIAGLLKQKRLVIDSIYIGGGTPTVLDTEQLEKLFFIIKQNFDINNLREFTLEAGRTDTLTVEKLRIAKDNGVDRICLNPQSMNQQTLDAVKRPCQVEDIKNYVSIIRELGFKILNMDLIIGLGNEGADDFLNSLDQVISYSPENITIHNLSIKKGSKIKNDFGISVDDGYGEDFYQKVRQILLKAAYDPYYLYRLKYTAGNSENIGYAKSGAEGIYNIMMMSEKQTIIGIGAGATGNIYFEKSDEIKKIFTVKDIKTYNDRFEKIVEKKCRMISEAL
ncbi:coproporphyrinogen dehydrogenase HemZ [Eubacteriaceae bacterium ES2]|nr:coproporphyrinogen dehydrogenase HemZ [Eubacteriaceae bacterium ES2]